jgi:hypothetical protein
MRLQKILTVTLCWVGVVLTGYLGVMPPSLAYAEPAVMAQGWSYGEEDSLKAAQTAIAELKQDLGDRQPAVIFTSATSIKLDVPVMMQELRQAFPDTPIWGATSALGIFMNNAYDYMQGSALGLLALCSADYRMVVAGASIAEYEKSYVKAAQPLIQKAKETYKNEIPAMILFTSNPGAHEEAILEALKQAFGREIPIFAGSTGTEDPNPRYAIANGEAYAEGLSFCFIYTDKKIGHSYQMGFKRENVSGIATAVDGRWLNSIDGKPALEVYNQWTNGFFTEAIQAEKSIRGAGQMLHPLAIVKKTPDGNELVISLSAKTYSKESGGIEFFACVDQGDTLTLLKGDTDSLVNRAYLGVAKAKTMVKGKIAGGLVFHCSGARLLLEEQGRTKEMAPKLKQAFGEQPFILMFLNGEHGCIPGSESFHGNLMLDVVVFEE